MCSPTLFIATTRKNWSLLLIFLAVLSFYMAVMIAMYDPQDMQAITSMLDLFPKDLMQMMGFSQLITDLTQYLASWLYGLLMLGFPMVYCIILGNRLVAKPVDSGSFAYLLSTPNSREKIILTLGLYALVSVGVLFLGLFGMGVLLSWLLLPHELDIVAFLNLNITTMLVNMLVMMIAFFFSCLFNDSRRSSSFGAGLPILFLLMNMLGGASDQAAILQKASIYGLYDPLTIVAQGGALAVDLLYLALILILFGLSVLVFRNKRLPL